LTLGLHHVGFFPGVGAVPGGNCGLILAFGSALFSTVARESECLDHGHPGFGCAHACHARGFDDSALPGASSRSCRVRDAMDYEVTRAGMVYIAITVVIGIASINTGNNLLLHRGRGALVRHPGFRGSLGTGVALSRTGCEFAGARFCRSSDVGAAAIAECEWLDAVVFNSAWCLPGAKL